jgi:hypothetical protein
MSEAQNNNSENIQQVDPTSELVGKTNKLAEDNASLNAKLDQALQLIQQQNMRLQVQPQQADPANMTDEQIEELSYRDPKGYARAVSLRAEARAAAMIDQKLGAQQQVNSTMSALINDYPELGDQSSELSKRAVSIYQSLPAHIKADPIAYKAAVRDAAAELGLQVKTKRSSNQSSDNFSTSSSQGSKPSQRNASPKVDPGVVAIAERLGLNTSDPKVIERLAQRSQRNDWTRFR